MDLVDIAIKDTKVQLDSSIKNKKGLVPKIRDFNEYLVWKFLKSPAELDSKRWLNEMVIGKTVIKEYPNVRFWNDLVIDFKLNSLAFFLTYDGRELLRIEQNKFRLDFSCEKA